MNVELEKTYLLKKIPEGIEDYESTEIVDIYIPTSKEHPILRIRKKGDEYKITKKEPIEETDSSEQSESTILISKAEFKELSTNIKGKRLKKKRYYYPFKNKVAEIDFFLGKLKGLSLAEVEFDSKKEKSEFLKPSFCLVDVTQKEDVAGGMLAGKKYSDLEDFLESHGYEKIIFN